MQGAGAKTKLSRIQAECFHAAVRRRATNPTPLKRASASICANHEEMRQRIANGRCFAASIPNNGAGTSGESEADASLPLLRPKAGTKPQILSRRELENS